MEPALSPLPWARPISLSGKTLVGFHINSVYYCTRIVPQTRNERIASREIFRAIYFSARSPESRTKESRPRLSDDKQTSRNEDRSKMNYTMLKEARELAGWSAEGEAFSVYQALKKRGDPRRSQGKRSSLALLLTCVLLAKMAGETTLQAMTEWVRLRSSWLQEVLPETRAQFPCAAT